MSRQVLVAVQLVRIIRFHLIKMIQSKYLLALLGVKEAGLTGFRFNTIGVSDGISMGTDGMSYSLQSRDVIADSIETIMGGQVRFLLHLLQLSDNLSRNHFTSIQWYDALVAIPGCDKNMPGCLIAMGRLNRPAIMVYGGTIRAGCTEKFPQVIQGPPNP